VQLLVIVSVEVDEDDEYERDQSIIRMLCDIAPGFILSQVKRPTCRAGCHAVAGYHAVAGCHLCGATLRVFFEGKATALPKDRRCGAAHCTVSSYLPLWGVRLC
jgi:hypothetical protein